MDKLSQFFIKLGRGIKKGFFSLCRWVKETAWVQPLLIVGVIFGVILSIKPVVSWVSSIFDPDQTSEFYITHTVDDMTKLEVDYINKSEKKTVIVIFYATDDTSSEDVEKSLRNYQNDDVAFYCIDCDDDNSDTAKHKANQEIINYDFQKTFLDAYNKSYKDMPSALKSSSSDDLTFSDDDTTNCKVPTPLLARYDGEPGKEKELKGVYTGSISSDDLELFIEGNEEEWTQGYLNTRKGDV